MSPTPASQFSRDQAARGFERQLQTLKRVVHVVPLADALQALYGDGALPRRAVAITFDDGYQDALDIAAPLLERYDAPATFFLAPAIISRECDAWWERLGWAFVSTHRRNIQFGGRTLSTGTRRDRLAALEQALESLKTLDQTAREGAVDRLVTELDPVGNPHYRDLFLNWDGCRALRRRGFDVGSHSDVHSILSNEPAESQYNDLLASRKALEQELNMSVDLLAYPNGRRGDYAHATIAAARDAGYRYALTTVHGRNHARTPPFELRRIIVSPHQGKAGLLKLTAQLAAAPVRPRTGHDVGIALHEENEINVD